METGFGQVTAISVTVASGIATAALQAGETFDVGCVVWVEGATPAGLNGEARVLTASNTSITFATSAPDGAATGVIKIKVAPAGWVQAFSATNVSVIKSASVEATGLFLRVDDTGTTTCRVVGYESMSGASTGAAPFPLASQMAGGLWWPKSQAANATSRPWRIFARDRSFLLWVSPSTSATDQGTGMLFSFGDYLPARSGDAFSCLLTGGISAGDVGSSTTTCTGCLGYGNGNALPGNTFIARAPLAVGSALNVRKISAHNSAGSYSGGAGYSNNTFPYPNSANNALRLSPLELHHSTYGYLGDVAGVHHTAQTLGESFATDAPVQGEGAYAGRTLIALRVGPLAGGTVFVDSTGPWEF